MPIFRIREIQRVLVERLIEASSPEEAQEIFNNGEGEPSGKDGKVMGADLVSIEEIDDDAR